VGGSRWKKIARFRFRLGNVMKEERYWGKAEIRCKLCGGEEAWEHVWERCREWKKGSRSW